MVTTPLKDVPDHEETPDAFFSETTPERLHATPVRGSEQRQPTSPRTPSAYGGRYVPPVLPGMSLLEPYTPQKTPSSVLKKEKEIHNEQLRALREKHEAEMREMREKTSKVMEEKRRMERRCCEREKENTALKDELRQLQDKSAKRDTDLMKRTQELTKVRKSSSKQCEPLIAEVEQLKEEKQLLQRRFDEAAAVHKEEVQGLLSQVTSLEVAMQTYRAKEKEANCELETTREACRLKDDEAMVLKQKHAVECERLRSEVARLKGIVEKYEGEARTLRDTVGSLDNTKMTLREEVFALKQEHSLEREGLRHMVRGLEDEVARLQAVIDTFEGETRTLHDVISELDTTKTALKTAQEELSSFKMRNAALEQQLEIAEDQAKDFKSRLERSERDLATSDALLEAAKKVQDEYLNQMTSTAKLLKSSEYEREQLNAMLTNTQCTVKRQNEQLLSEIAESRETGILLGEALAKEKNLLLQMQTQADIIQELQLQLQAHPNTSRTPIKARVDSNRGVATGSNRANSSANPWDASMAEAVLRQSSALRAGGRR